MGALLTLCLEPQAFELKASQAWILRHSDSTSNYSLSRSQWEWKSDLSPHLNAQIQMDQTELWAKDTLAGLRSLNLQWLKQRLQIQTQRGPWQARFKYEGSPTADLAYQGSYWKGELGTTGPGQWRLHSQSTLGEERNFSWSPVDYFTLIQFENPHFQWNLRSQFSAYEISPKPWEFRRKSWSEQSFAKYRLGPWQLEGQAELGQWELSSLYQGFLWAKLDQSRWAQAQSQLSWQNKSWRFQAGWIWGHVQIGDDSFIEPFPLSPISALDALKWRWQKNQATQSTPWLGAQWRSHAPTFNCQLGSQVYGVQRLQLDGIFKTRRSTSPPFFTYQSQNLDLKSPYRLWQKLNAEFLFTHQTSELQVGLGQWLPWFPTQPNTSSPESSQASTDPKAKIWGGLDLEIHWKSPLP